jgi:hypothetical protein
MDDRTDCNNHCIFLGLFGSRILHDPAANREE